ncbi:phosphonate ABC transporter ATP-binding protein [Nonomuraea sp. AD125B]|uniref:phosphonate ABC transporter ATP-binding protein n=1 Tax=Nonomuraea sp. AD125B TaxID=3242897 RepID=UPI0035278065
MLHSAAEIVVSDVSVILGGRTVLADVTLKVEAGERLALLGPSGAGKTTLLRTIVGAVAPTSGRVSVDEADPFGPRREITRLRRTIGCVRQRDDLVPGLSARANILAGIAHRWSPADWVTIVCGRVPRRFVPRLLDLAALHDITPLLPQRVEHLSGGERQRVALARALFGEPRLILADECTSGLDPVRAAVALRHLRASGSTVVATTHDLNVAGCCDRVVALRDGRIVYDGPPPATEEVERIYGTAGREDMVTGRWTI